MLKFSPSTGGFYVPEVHGAEMPADVVDVPEEQHAELMAGQAAGQRIVAGADGSPVLQDPPRPPVAQREEEALVERDRLLSACDWVVLKSYERGEPVPAAWISYRQALRDVPGQAGFPDTIDWPSAPTSA